MILYILSFILLSVVSNTKQNSNSLEKYNVKQGDCLSCILIERGLTINELLDSKNSKSILQDHKDINPHVEIWKLLKPDETIFFRKKNIIDKEAKFVSAQVKLIDDIILDEEEQVLLEENNNIYYKQNYFFKHKLGISMGINYATEKQKNLFDIKMDPIFTIPSIQYNLYFTPYEDQSTWETRFFTELNYIINHTLDSNESVPLPINGKLEFGIAKLNVVNFDNNFINAYLGFKYIFDSSVSSDKNKNKKSRRLNIYSIGFKPELVTFVNNTKIVYAPFVYKSIYGKSSGEKISGYELGFRTDFGLAFNNRLNLFTEYSFDYYKNNQDSDPAWSRLLHRMLLGINYIF